MNDIPYAWYLTRSSALVGFFLLYVSIFSGLAVRTPLLNKIIKPIHSAKIHCWISLQALIFAAIHGGSLLFDKFINFSWKNILIPFYPLTQSQAQRIDVGLMALGIFGFYIMLLLVASSYLRKGLSAQTWRAVHFLNISLYVITLVHSLYLGTDLKSEGVVRSAFIYANGFLMFLFLLNIILRLVRFKNRNNQI
jgi:methionine sulfoxide reductase heme-binding subunit